MNPRFAGLIAAAALVVAIGGPALASGGTVYVTSSCSSSGSLEDNSLIAGDTVYVWVKATGPNALGTLTWTAFNTPGNTTASGTLTLDTCTRGDGKYVLYIATDFPSSPLGSWTLTVWSTVDSTTTSVSSDSFQLFTAIT